MKKFYLCCVLSAALLTSCASTYQVLETASSDVKSTETAYAYTGNDLDVSYNLWDGAGDMWFQIYNKTEKPLYVDLDRSHLIVNGNSIDYYSDEQVTSTTTRSSNVPTPQGFWPNQLSVSSKMKRIVEIPPRSYITVGGKKILSGPVAACGLGKKQKGVASSATFTSTNTPVAFRNYVTYSTDYNMIVSRIVENSFYVQRVHSMDYLTLLGKRIKQKDCPEDKFSKQVYESPFKKPQNIYLFDKSPTTKGLN